MFFFFFYIWDLPFKEYLYFFSGKLHTDHLMWYVWREQGWQVTHWKSGFVSKVVIFMPHHRFLGFSYVHTWILVYMHTYVCPSICMVYVHLDHVRLRLRHLYQVEIEHLFKVATWNFVWKLTSEYTSNMDESFQHDLYFMIQWFCTLA